MDISIKMALLVVKVLVTQFVFDSLPPHGLWPTRLPCPWNSLGKNTGVVAISFSRESSWPRDWTQVSSVAGRCFIIWAKNEWYSKLVSNVTQTLLFLKRGRIKWAQYRSWASQSWFGKATLSSNQKDSWNIAAEVSNEPFMEGAVRVFKKTNSLDYIKLTHRSYKYFDVCLQINILHLIKFHFMRPYASKDWRLTTYKK